MRPVAVDDAHCRRGILQRPFHVQQLYNEAVDKIRVDICRLLIAENNNRDKSAPTATYSNGETMRQILARSKYTLMMSQNK